MNPTKFKIMYPNDHEDPTKRGQPFFPSHNELIVLSESGVFYILEGDEYDFRARLLTKTLPIYDVFWR